MEKLGRPAERSCPHPREHGQTPTKINNLPIHGSRLSLRSNLGLPVGSDRVGAPERCYVLVLVPEASPYRFNWCQIPSFRRSR